MDEQRLYPDMTTIVIALDQVLRKGPLTLTELCAEVDVAVGLPGSPPIPVEYVRAAIHEHRMEMTGPDALIAENEGRVHRYEITDDPVRIRGWLAGRSRDADTRLATMLSLAEIAVNVTHPSSKEGRRARLERKVIGRLIDDIEEIVAS